MFRRLLTRLNLVVSLNNQNQNYESLVTVGGAGPDLRRCLDVPTVPNQHTNLLGKHAIAWLQTTNIIQSLWLIRCWLRWQEKKILESKISKRGSTLTHTLLDLMRRKYTNFVKLGSLLCGQVGRSRPDGSMSLMVIWFFWRPMLWSHTSSTDHCVPAFYPRYCQHWFSVMVDRSLRGRPTRRSLCGSN